MGGSIGKKKSKIIIVGLDNSGKSTMINLLKPKKVGNSKEIHPPQIGDNTNSSFF